MLLIMLKRAKFLANNNSNVAGLRISISQGLLWNDLWVNLSEKINQV